jgi:hypothetical protein
MGLIAVATLYIMMVVSQMYGPQIIQFLHGAEAMEVALDDAATSTIHPDAPLLELCQGYEKAHFDVTSNVLHAGGMIASLALVLLAFLRPRLRGVFDLVYLAPLYYLPAWIGHFWLQRDIPAVFSYGMTLRGLVSGEYCAWVALIERRVLHSSLEVVQACLFSVLLLALPLYRTNSPEKRKMH